VSEALGTVVWGWAMIINNFVMLNSSLCFVDKQHYAADYVACQQKSEFLFQRDLNAQY